MHSIKKSLFLFEEVESDYFSLIVNHLYDVYNLNDFDFKFYKKMWCYKTPNGAFVANDEEIEQINNFLQRFVGKATSNNIVNISENLNFFFNLNSKLENFLKYKKKVKNIDYWKFLIKDLNYLKTLNTNEKNIEIQTNKNESENNQYINLNDLPMSLVFNNKNVDINKKITSILNTKYKNSFIK